MKNILKRLFLHDVLRKLISLVFAVAIYFSISSSITEGTVLKGVPVSVSAHEKYRFDAKDIKTNVKVSVTKNVVNDIKADDLKLQIKFNERNVAGDMYTYTPSAKDFTCPRGVTIKSCEPIKFYVQKIITKRVPVNIKYKGKLGKEYRVSCSAPMVAISGSKQVINSIESISAAAVPLAGAGSSFDYEAELIVPQGVKCKENSVTVKVEIERVYEERLIKDVPVFMLTAGENDKYSFAFADGKAKVDVMVSGAPAALKSFNKSMLRPYVDVTRVKARGVQSLSVRCSHPADEVVVKSIAPLSVKVRAVEIKK